MLPKWQPFLVKKAVLSKKLTQHPITSPVVKVGPYVLPVPEQQKEWPSSPWYPQEKGSHPNQMH
jgi:hypothetical protein